MDNEASPSLKLDRAKEHFHQFVAELDEYYRSDPWIFSTSFDGNDLVLRLESHTPIPARFALLVGDLVHNARSALDCAVFEIASRGLGSLGRPPTWDEEVRLSFPMTTKRSSFTEARKKLHPFLPDSTLAAIEVLQPWREAEILAEHLGNVDNPAAIEGWINLSYMRRLNTLSNIDKHRRLTMSIFRPDSVGESIAGESGFDFTDDEDRFEGIRWLGVPKRERMAKLPPEALPEGFSFPDPNDTDYDFHFDHGDVEDGCEIGRYISTDRTRKMEILNVHARLRVVLHEPGLTDKYPGAPRIERVLAEIIDEVSEIIGLLDPSRDWDVQQIDR